MSSELAQLGQSRPESGHGVHVKPLSCPLFARQRRKSMPYSEEGMLRLARSTDFLSNENTRQAWFGRDVGGYKSLTDLAKPFRAFVKRFTRDKFDTCCPGGTEGSMQD